ncbi:MAG: hypothetical protein ACYDBX_04335 [Patescibacteria group bacterium]
MIDKTICIYDSGSCTPLAQALVGKFKKVYYFSPWEKDGFPEYKDDQIGTGIKGVIRTSYPFDLLDEIDLWVFPDVYYGSEQRLLRRLGKLVWGAGATKSCWMELDRFGFREWQDKNNMLVPDSEIYDGLDDLMKNLPNDKFIKFGRYRGDAETFKYYDKARSEYRGKELELHHGIFSKEIEVMAESKIEGYEPGLDTYLINGNMPNKIMWGIEQKDGAYIGKISDKINLPKQLQYVNSTLEPQFKKERTTSFMSYEVRTNTKDKGTVIDMTMRCPIPPYQSHLAMIDNLAEIFWYGAQGIMVQPKYNSTYCAVVILKSDFAEEHVMPLKVPEKNKEWVFLMGLAIRNNEYYSVTSKHWGGEFGAIVGTGNSKDEAIKNCIEHTKGVEGDSLTIDTDALYKAEKDMNEMKSLGVTF